MLCIVQKKKEIPGSYWQKTITVYIINNRMFLKSEIQYQIQSFFFSYDSSSWSVSQASQNDLISHILNIRYLH